VVSSGRTSPVSRLQEGEREKLVAMEEERPDAACDLDKRQAIVAFPNA